MNNHLILFLQLAGLMHLGLLCAGALMPRAVNLRQNIAVLPTFIQKLFWVYYTFIALCLVAGALGAAVTAPAIPAWYASFLSRIVPSFLLPFTADQVRMSQQDNVADMSGFANTFGWVPQSDRRTQARW